jgi:putative peptide zinc metalloprotease protein
MAIADAVSAETPLHLEVHDVEAVIRFLQDNQLLQPPVGSAGILAKMMHKRKGTVWEWLLHNYLFFRIPLIKPDRWLNRWASSLDFFFSRQFWVLSTVVLLLGILGVYREWDSFTTTLVDMFSWSGMMSYGVALIAVKSLHELGHACTAKRFGCRVPTMGVAFLVLWPMAYTDTNEVWKLTSRRQRMQVVSAGILTELTIAAWSTLAWVLLPDGTPKSLAFVLATTTWVSSIAINASPFMRFDGYFLLSDWLGMPNLHARAFALARWDLRERLFALGEPVPEIFSRQRHTGLVLFAYTTWIYRLVVFLGIAAMVYAFFIKAVGILLFLVELCWFILLPPYREFQAWRLRWPALRASRRALRSGLIALALLVLFVVPWPTQIATLGLLRPAEQFIIFSPPHAQVVGVPFAEGSQVKKGDVLLQLASPNLASRELAAKARVERMRWGASSGAFDAEQRAQWLVLQEQLTTASTELVSIQADALRYTPTAPFDGVLRDVSLELRPGMWLGAQEPLARLVDDRQLQVVTYLEEDEVARVTQGDRARFYSEGLEGPFMPLALVRVDPDASRTLPDAQLSSTYGGNILVREKNGLLYPEKAVYRVTFKATGTSGKLAGHTWRGKVVIAGQWTSPGMHFLRTAMGIFWRETGF